jgi:ferritin-like metal-binding protein YciE
MAAPQSLNDLYLEELQDLLSANDQMKGMVEKMAADVDDASLGERLRRSAEGVEKHSTMLRDLISGAGKTEETGHCKGMEGLVAEARRHALESGAKGPVKDVAIIAQYQRMCHYGIAGFGTAKAYAEALGRRDDAQKLDEALKHIYQSDEYMSELAERSKNMQAAR